MTTIYDLTISTKDEHMQTLLPNNPTPPRHKLKRNRYMITKRQD